MIASWMQDVGAGRFFAGTEPQVWRIFSQKSVSSEETVWCPTLKEIKQTAGETLRREAVSERVTWIDKAQQAVIASFQKRLEYYEGQRGRDEKRKRARSSGDSGPGSFEELAKRCNRKK